jgi:ABC-type Zn uptake system ZnuABC Zn-binding protein ZnuA
MPNTRLATASWMAPLLALVLTACTSEPAATPESGPRFVTTIPPFAMILEPIVGDQGTVVRLLEPGASPHTHDPRPSDLRAVDGSAAVLYGAEHLDAWAADLPASRHLALVDLLPAPARRSMANGHGGSGHAVDPHFWTDPLAVRQLLPPLVDSLCAAAPSGCTTYRANADTFATQLGMLAGRLRVMMEPVRDVTVMLAQPFFRYFLHAYGPHLAGVIEPQPGKEPSPRRIQTLTKQIRADSVQAIFTQHQLPPRSAEVVAEAAGVPIHTLDPLGGADGRTSYEALILYNARQIAKALRRDA